MIELRNKHTLTGKHAAFRSYFARSSAAIFLIEATSTIPVVAFMIDPLQARVVTSLARPGGNLTGITLDAGIENFAKRLQILRYAGLWFRGNFAFGWFTDLPDYLFGASRSARSAASRSASTFSAASRFACAEASIFAILAASRFASLA